MSVGVYSRGCRYPGTLSVLLKWWQRWGRNSHPAPIHPGTIHTHCSFLPRTTGLLDNRTWPARMGPFRSSPIRGLQPIPFLLIVPDVPEAVAPGRSRTSSPGGSRPMASSRGRFNSTSPSSVMSPESLLASLHFLLIFLSNPLPVLPVFNNPGHGHQL